MPTSTKAWAWTPGQQPSLARCGEISIWRCSLSLASPRLDLAREFSLCSFGHLRRQHRDRLDLEQRTGSRQLRNRNGRARRRRRHIEILIANFAKNADVRHVDEIVVDLDHVF